MNRCDHQCVNVNPCERALRALRWRLPASPFCVLCVGGCLPPIHERACSLRREPMPRHMDATVRAACPFCHRHVCLRRVKRCRGATESTGNRAARIDACVSACMHVIRSRSLDACVAAFACIAGYIDAKAGHACRLHPSIAGFFNLLPTN